MEPISKVHLQSNKVVRCPTFRCIPYAQRLVEEARAIQHTRAIGRRVKFGPRIFRPCDTASAGLIGSWCSVSPLPNPTFVCQQLFIHNQ
jgi:hypothetical protein